MIVFKDLISFGKKFGYDFTVRRDYVERNEPPMRTLGDCYIGFNDWRRQTMRQSIDEAFKAFPVPQSNQLMGTWTLDGAKRFIKRYEDWKEEEDQIDFTDLLEFAYQQGLSPDPEITFLDEAQDCSPLQWALCDMWSQESKRFYVGFDDDQALYGWIGAVPDLALKHKSDKDTILGQSYRVPIAVHSVARKIISQNKNRMPKPYLPKPSPGACSYYGGIHQVPFKDLEGTIFVLGRNHYLLEPVAELLDYQGLLFKYRGEKDIKTTAKGTAVFTLQALQQNKKVTAEALATTVDLIHSRPYLAWGAQRAIRALGSESPMSEISLADLKDYFKPDLLKAIAAGDFLAPLKEMGDRERARLTSLLKNGSQDARITLSTIHGVKGMEADHVVLLSDMSGRTYHGMLADMEAERRVQYVAVTRAKETLSVIAPTKGYYYRIPI